MTDGPEKAASPRGAERLGEDIVDAEYETVADKDPNPRAADPAPASSIGTPTPPLAGMDMLRGARPERTGGAAVRGGPLFWVFGVGLAVAAFWVSGGHALVRSAPFLQTQAPLKALRISGVKSRVDVSGARPILFVDGEAANDGSAAEILPALEIVVTGNDGRITRYRLGTAARFHGPWRNIRLFEPARCP